MTSRILFRTSSQQLKNEREKKDLKSLSKKYPGSSALTLEVHTENKNISKVFTYDTGRVVFSPMYEQ